LLIDHPRMLGIHELSQQPAASRVTKLPAIYVAVANLAVADGKCAARQIDSRSEL
jgi:hypothetical protein